jgi:hypothetical protein
MKNLKCIALSMANDNGRNTIEMICKCNFIIALYPTVHNWFYVVLSNNKVYAISQKNDSGSTSFGDIHFFLKYAEKNNLNAIPTIEVENLKPCFSNITYISKKYSAILSAVLVCFNDTKEKCYIKNSGENVWIDTNSILSII